MRFLAIGNVVPHRRMNKTAIASSRLNQARRRISLLLPAHVHAIYLLINNLCIFKSMLSHGTLHRGQNLQNFRGQNRAL